MVNQSQSATPLAAPEITGARDSQGTPIFNPGTTQDTALTLSGRADPSVVVIILDNGTIIGTASVTINSTWATSVTAALGEHRFTVQVSGGVQSPAWVITVSAGVGTLPAPTVQNAPTGTLDPIAAKDTLTVVVPQYDGMAATDKLSVTWTGAPGTPAGGSHTTALVDVGTVGIKQIQVPPSVLAFSLGKSVTVKYTVVRGGNSTDSLPLTVVVLTLPSSALTQPKILQAANGGEGLELDVTSLSANATLRVSDWPLIALNQYVWLQLRGTKTDGSAYSKQLWTPPTSKTNASWISNRYYEVAVSQAELKALKDTSSLTLEFKAGLGGSRVESDAVTFPLRTYRVKALPELIIDAATMLLNTGPTRVPGWVRNNASFPGEKLTRVATGGMPPYTYTSSNSSVASVVSTTGEVTGLHVGQTTITVRDAANAMASYPVSIPSHSGELIFNRASLTCDEALAWAATLPYFTRGVALGTLTALQPYYSWPPVDNLRTFWACHLDSGNNPCLGAPNTGYALTIGAYFSCAQRGQRFPAMAEHFQMSPGATVSQS